jgi:hypothetical protein
MNRRPTFIVTFRPEPGVDGIRSLRALLKLSLRRLGLRALSAEEKARSAVSRYSEKLSKLREGGIYKVGDLEASGPVVLIIDRLLEDVKMFDRTNDLLCFEGHPKQLQVNVTNGEALIKLFGDNPDDWAGKEIELFLQEYQLGKFGIRVRLPGTKTGNGPRATTLPQTKPDSNDEIPLLRVSWPRSTSPRSPTNLAV